MAQRQCDVGVGQPERAEERRDTKDRGSGDETEGQVAAQCAGGGFVEGAVMLGGFTFLSPATAHIGLGPVASAIVLGSYGLATLAGIPLVDVTARMLRPAAAFGTGGAILAGGYAVAALLPTAAGLLFASVALGLAFALLQSALQSWSTELRPNMRGTTTSLVAASVFTGAAAGTSAGAGLIATHDYSLLFGLAAATALVVALVGAVARARWHQPAPTRDAVPGPP